MDVREKLVELFTYLLECELDGDCSVIAKEWADHLVANGVTVQEWISVKDRLPEKDGYYLVWKAWGTHRWHEVLSFAKDGRKVDKYDFKREWKNVWYKYDSEYGYITIDSVTHWMPLPQPPEGE